MKKIFYLIISALLCFGFIIPCCAYEEYYDYEQDYYDGSYDEYYDNSYDEYYDDSYDEYYDDTHENDYDETYNEAYGDNSVYSTYGSTYENGIDEDNGVPQKKRNPILWIFIDIAIGFAVAFIIMKAVTSNLKSVKKQTNANSYVVKNSFVLTGKNDMFLRTERTKTALPKNNPPKG